MKLFEESGIILKSGEKLIKRGEFKGRVWAGFTVESIPTPPIGIPYTTLPKVNFANAKGELILTNKRLIPVGLDKRKIIWYPGLELTTLFAITGSGNILSLCFQLGFGILATTSLEINDASEWAEAIREQCLTK